MSIAASTIEQLTNRLTDGSSAPLTADERALLVASLETLAQDQAVIVRLQRLLVARGESLDRIDGLLSSALASVRARLQQPDPDEGYDYAAADLARHALAGAVQDAASGKATIAAALQFVRDFVALAG